MPEHSVRTILAVLAVVLMGTSAAFAQASRTWVSGVGDDANPCSRTAPCRTFAGAISKTAARGEISVLDDGGFGAVNITKSITINGTARHASILATGSNGISINAGTTGIVRLLHLQINGAGTGLVGIRLNAAAALLADDVTVHGFASGIATYAGKATLTHSVIAQNSAFGIQVFGGTLLLEDSTLADNNVAAQANDPGTLRLSNVGMYDNLAGIGCGGGPVLSAANNRKAGNAGGPAVCSPTGPITVY